MVEKVTWKKQKQCNYISKKNMTFDISFKNNFNLNFKKKKGVDAYLFFYAGKKLLKNTHEKSRNQ